MIAGRIIPCLVLGSGIKTPTLRIRIILVLHLKFVDTYIFAACWSHCAQLDVPADSVCRLGASNSKIARDTSTVISEYPANNITTRLPLVEPVSSPFFHIQVDWKRLPSQGLGRRSASLVNGWPPVEQEARPQHRRARPRHHLQRHAAASAPAIAVAIGL